MTKKTIVITGGTSGIGLATALKFDPAEQNVIVIGRNPEKNAKVQATYPDLHVYQADLSKVAEITTVFAQIAKDFGQIDTLFANAGFGIFKPFTELTEQDFDYSVDINYKSVFFTIQNALKSMPDGSSIVVNVSWTYHRGLDTASAYSSSKAAVSYLIKALALELADRAIRINAVSPGYINTAQFNQASMPAAEYQAKVRNVPTGRFGNGEEIGNVVKFLASDKASYLNGQEIVIDGGLTSVQMD